VTLYLYAIVGTRPRGALGVGIAKKKLRALRVGRMHVVVERAPAPAVSRTTLLGHDRVVRRIARLCPGLLPFRFGSVATDEGALADLLAPFSSSIERALERTSGCVQFTLRVHGEPMPKVRRGPDRRVGPGTRWLTERREARRVPEIDAVTRATAPWVREMRFERHDRPPLLASVYHLVPRANVSAWRAATREAERDLVGVTIRTSGPWPPYAFAELP
jgi:gas vesicle protein GvpL/GvpF